MPQQTVTGDMHVTGALTAGSLTLPTNTVRNAAVDSSAAIARSKLEQNTEVPFPISLNNWRVHDDFASLLPSAAANDDLGVIEGTFGSAFPTIQAGDVGGTASTRYARTVIAVPAEYDAGQTFNIRFRSRVTTTACDTSCTIDLSAYEHNGDGAIGGDLVTTAAQDMNSTSYANFDFVVTPTTLSAGDQLDIRVAIAYNDAGDAGVMIPTISKAEVLCDIRG